MIATFVRSRKFVVVIFLILLGLIVGEAVFQKIPAFAFIVVSLLLSCSLVSCLWEQLRKRYASLSLTAIGFLVFHAALLIIMTGGMITYFTYSIGYVEIAEGHGFVDTPDSYTGWRQKFGIRQGTGVAIIVNKIIMEFWKNGQIKEFKNELIIKDKGPPKNKAIDVNDSVTHGKLLINMARQYGLAPFFTLMTIDGGESGYVYVRDDTKTNEFVIPRVGLRATVSYKNIQEREIFLAIEDQGKTLTKHMKGGDSLTIGQDTLVLSRVDLWNGLTVVTDSGKEITYSGIFLFLVGLILYYTKSFSTLLRADQE